MKTMVCIGFVICSLAMAQAHDSDYDSTAVVYDTPVVFHSPVVYHAPVFYYAPVYYNMNMAAAAVAGYSDYYVDRNPSTVIHITSSGTYTRSNYGDCAPSVIRIGHTAHPRSSLSPRGFHSKYYRRR